MLGLWTISAMLGGLIAVGGWESWRHRRNLKSIPIRIHVNGTRGKSSVTRLIVAALQEAGIRTVGKTTGTLPRLLLPDGTEQAVERVSSANVIEQRGIVNAARQHGAEALVIECMALQPQLQWLCECKLVNGTHGVVTNARADHLDVMGPTEVDVAKALANMTPCGGKLFTAERKHLGVFAHAADDRGSLLIPTKLEDVEAVTDEEMSRFPYSEHKENVALVLSLCNDLGIDRETALRGMWKVLRDPGAMTLHEVDFFGRRIVFSNAFAANDPASTETAWDTSIQRAGQTETKIALINCRSDRPDRSWQIGEACPHWQAADYYLLTGTGRHVFTRAAVKNGLDPQRIVEVDDNDISKIFETIVEVGGESTVVVGMGNIGKHGLEIVQYFKNRSVLPSQVRRKKNRRHHINRIQHIETSSQPKPKTKRNGHGAERARELAVASLSTESDHFLDEQGED